MRHIEIGLGVLVIAAAVALASGYTDAKLPVPPIGFAGTLALVTIGASLVAHGLIGLRIKRNIDNSAPLRVLGRTIFTLTLALLIVIAVPALVAPLNLGTVAGFPVGFYLAAQGALLALAVLAFRAAQQMDAAEAGLDSDQSVASTGYGER
jgi:putative solute:sodium symporter small subunit